MVEDITLTLSPTDAQNLLVFLKPIAGPTKLI